jgi:branched-chain amino acid transport system substrate-binding protein
MHWIYEAAPSRIFLPSGPCAGLRKRENVTREDNMEQHRRRLSNWLLALAGALIAVSPWTAPARAAEPIKIGMSLALTGTLASGGKVMLITLKMWEEDINAKGGLLGRPVQLVYYDDQSNGSLVPGIYTKLLDVDKVDLVVSSYATNVAAPAMPIVMQRNKVFLSLFCIALNSEFKYPRYFSMHPAGPNPKPAFSEGFFKVAMAQTPKPETVAMVTADGEATRLVTDGAYDNIKQAGLKIVYDRRYPLNTTDFSPIVRAVQATNPDIFFVSSYPLDSVGMLRSLNEIGFKPKIVGGTLNGLPAPVLKAQLGPALNGVINYEFWLPSPQMASAEALDVIKRYQERARGEGVDPIGIYVPPWAYAFAQILEQSIKGTGSIDDGKLADYMRNTTFKTTVGDVKFGPDGEWEKGRLLTVQHHDIKGTDIMQFKDTSTMTVLDPPEYATGKLIYPYENAKK